MGIQDGKVILDTENLLTLNSIEQKPTLISI